MKGGRCEACTGDGTLRIEMNFLPDVYVPCAECHGARYNRETLEVHYKGKTIAEVPRPAHRGGGGVLRSHPAISRHLTTLVDVGPDTSASVSPRRRCRGEAQRQTRQRVAATLDRSHGVRPDEPTTGCTSRTSDVCSGCSTRW